MAVSVKPAASSAADSLHLPVHRSRWRDEISTRSGSNHRLLTKIQQGSIVIHTVIAQHAAVAVRGIFAETGVGHHDHFRHGLFANARHTGDQTVLFRASLPVASV